MTARFPAVAILIALALIAGLCGVFTMPPLDRDESRYAQATAQMLESGDFVRINFQDGPRNKKPVGIHWLQTVAVSTFSDVEARAIWAYRLPSVLALIIAVIATYVAGLKLLDRTSAFAGAALLAVCVVAGVEAGIAKTDAALLAATTTAMAALATFYRGGGLGSILTFWIALAVGILIKGPVTPMVAFLALFALLFMDINWRQQWRGVLVTLAVAGSFIGLSAAAFVYGPALIDVAAGAFGATDGAAPLAENALWALLVIAPLAPLLAFIARHHAFWATRLIWPAYGPLVGVLLAAPWFIAIWFLTDGAFFSDALGKDLGPKMVSAHETHGGPFGLHTLLLPILIWPATLFLLPGLVQGARALASPGWTRERDAMRFLAAWILPTWLVFEFLPTKLVHYTLPLYPALALLAGAAFAALKEKRLGDRRTAAMAISVQLFSLAGVLLLLAIAVVAALTDPADLRRLSDAQFSDALDIVMGALAGLPGWAWLGLTVGLLAILFAPFALLRAPNSLLAFALAAGLAWHVAALQWAAPRQEGLFVSATLSQELQALSLHPARSSVANPPLVVTGYNEPSLVFLTDTETVLAAGAVEAALIAAEGPARAATVDASQEELFLAALEALGAEAVRVGVVDGLNYSRGDAVQLLIFRTTRPAAPEVLEQARQQLSRHTASQNGGEDALTRDDRAAPQPVLDASDAGAP